MTDTDDDGSHPSSARAPIVLLAAFWVAVPLVFVIEFAVAAYFGVGLSTRTCSVWTGVLLTLGAVAFEAGKGFPFLRLCQGRQNTTGMNIAYGVSVLCIAVMVINLWRINVGVQ